MAAAHSAESEEWGKVGSDVVHAVTLTSPAGVEVRIAEIGAALISFKCPDREGRSAEVSLGAKDAADLAERNPAFLGVIVGRIANRVAGAAFHVEGKRYALAANNGENHLHGGTEGFHKALWRCQSCVGGDSAASATFALHSPDGHEGYPGAVDATATYTLAGRTLSIDLRAVSAAATTPLALTSHAYWNLGGNFGASVGDHRLRLWADRVLPTGPSQIPEGEPLPVADTPFDFQTARRIGERLDEVRGGALTGYDHCWVVNGAVHGSGTEGDPFTETDPCRLRPVARLEHPGSGRWLEMRSSLPGVQVYTGNGLDAGAGSVPYGAVALEAQHLPDAVNQGRFPSVLCRPGEPFDRRIEITVGA